MKGLGTAVKRTLDETSFGDMKPSLSVYLNASVNVQDTIGKNNQVVKSILKDLEKIKRIPNKHSEKCAQKIEKLVYFIVQTLRRVHSDHLLQTTVIWVLITLLRANYQFSRKIMVASGIPGVLFEIMSAHVLSGATRQYASELCFFLCSDDPNLDPEKLPNMQGPVVDDLPSVSFVDRIVKQDPNQSLNEGSFLRSVESSYTGTDDRGSLPFVPYVINDDNIKALDKLFDDQHERFSDGRAHNSAHPLLSGAAARPRKRRTNDNDNDNDDDSSIASSATNDSVSIAAIDMLSQSLGFDHLDNRKTLGRGAAAGSKSSNNINLFNIKPKSMQNTRTSNIDMKKKTVRNAYTAMQQARGNTGQSVGSLNKIKHASNIHNDDYNHDDDMQFDNEIGSIGGMSYTSIASPYVSVGSVGGSVNGSPERRPKSKPVLSLDDRSFASKPNTPAVSKQANVNRFLTSFDPLALTHPGKSANDVIRVPEPEGGHFAKNITSEMNDDEESVGTRSSDDSLDSGGSSADERESLGSPAKEKPARKPKKLRIRAEKLVNHKFTKALFTKKASIKDTQSLLKRLTDILELVDKEQTGYVTWSYFGRVIMALAPPNLLRADIDEFLSAQVSNSEDLINYKEFLISGKVSIIEKINGRSILPINGWLERQREYVGDATTYTWKNHMEWYQTRKRTAVVWLMRRATNALTKEVDILNAARFLFHKGDQAKAISGLLDYGHKAITAHEKRQTAKKRLLARAMHARRAKIRREDAFIYLRELATKVVDVEAILAAKGEKVTYEDVLDEPEVQCNIATVYSTYYKHVKNQEWLVARAKKGLAHCKAQDDAHAALKKQGKKLLAQLILVQQAADWLYQAAERYHAYTCVQDDVMLGLLRIGARALAYFDRQAAALPWLLQRGVGAEAHSTAQDEAGASLVKLGQFKLNLLNNREITVAYLKKRRYDAERLIINKIEAIAFLRAQVRNFFKAGTQTADATVWLKKRADRGLLHSERQSKAVKRLIYAGGRAKVVAKRVQFAFLDLHQIGQWARITNFNKLWPKLQGGQNIPRIEEEMLRLNEKLAKLTKERAAYLKDKPVEESWFLELQDAYKGLANAVFMPGESVNDKKSLLDISREKFLSRIGFLKLMQNGKLLQKSMHEIAEEWHHVDPTGKGFVPFDEIWYWFKEQAVELHRKILLKSKGNKGFKFKAQDMWGVADQAMSIFKARFALQEKKIAEGKRGEEAEEEESSEEEEEEEKSEEEEEEEPEEVDMTLSEMDRVFMKLIAQHHSKGEERAAAPPAGYEAEPERK